MNNSGSGGRSNRTRRPGFNRGRWLLERQRCRIADERPPAPPGEANHLGAALEAVLHQLRARAGVLARSDDRVATLWDAIQGPELKGHCRRGPYEDGVFILYVESNLWLHQIRRFHARRIEQLLRERLGPSFKRLVLRLEPD